MTRLALAAGLFGLAALSAPARADDKDEKKALKELEGTYQLVSMEKGPLKITADDLKKAGGTELPQVVIKGDQIIAKFGPKEDPATIKVDPTKKPAHIDITSKKDNKIDYGIYKLEGGVLTICAVDEAQPKDRPTEFKASEKAMILVLKKVPAK